MIRIFSSPRSLPHIFYAFTGFHSLLIGLFLFYVPVYLWERGADLAGISAFIAMVGFSFCGSLWLWDRLRRRLAFKDIIAASFFIEIAALSTIFLRESIFFLPCLAVILGAYNCFFWIIQRVLFVSTISTDNSGKKFGNFQIYVAIIFKIAIFTGGFILEKYGFISLYFLSVFFSVWGALYFYIQPMQHSVAEEMSQTGPLSLAFLWNFRDRQRSKIIFALDGFFLYLESYFWIISLFFLTQKSFLRLGLLVIILAIVLSIIFFIIKNRIDRADKQKVYLLAVALYMAGWYMRGLVRKNMDDYILYSLIICITFFTSFFRLAFNKRFFDHAKHRNSFKYILLKSYYSQFYLGIIFAGLALCYLFPPNFLKVTQILSYTYFASSGLALLYLLYPASKAK